MMKPQKGESMSTIWDPEAPDDAAMGALGARRLEALALEWARDGAATDLASCLEAGARADATEPGTGASLLDVAAAGQAMGAADCVKALQKKLRAMGLPTCSAAATRSAIKHGWAQREMLLALLEGNALDASPLSAEQLNASEGLREALGSRDEELIKVWARCAPQAKLPNGMTPLAMAAGRDEPELVEALLSAGVDPLARDDNGGTALMWTVSSSKSLKILLPLSDPLATDSIGMSALMWASCMQTHLERGNLENVKALMPVSDPLARDREGRTALMLALRGGSGEIADVLAAEMQDPQLALPEDEDEARASLIKNGFPAWAARIESAKVARELDADLGPGPARPKARL
jgi:hypothetical protein